jgi:hypothetical protein
MILDKFGGQLRMRMDDPIVLRTIFRLALLVAALSAFADVILLILIAGAAWWLM